MDFMGMGALEASLILVVGFLVLGPARTIEAMRNVRGVTRKARGMLQGVTEQANKLLDEPRAALEEPREVVSLLDERPAGSENETPEATEVNGGRPLAGARLGDRRN